MTNAHENEVIQDPAVLVIEASFQRIHINELASGLADIAVAIGKSTKVDPHILLRAAIRTLEQRETKREQRHARNARRWRIPA